LRFFGVFSALAAKHDLAYLTSARARVAKCATAPSKKFSKASMSLCLNAKLFTVRDRLQRIRPSKRDALEKQSAK
jgi:hypothetical protein